MLGCPPAVLDAVSRVKVLSLPCLTRSEGTPDDEHGGNMRVWWLRNSTWVEIGGSGNRSCES